MEIKQFEYKPLSHYSYTLLSDGEIAIVDPQRDPIEYYKYAEENNAKIIAVIETHPHADFVSSHLQIQKETGATIYNSDKLGADYPYTAFDEGDSFKVGKATISAINTPGHSPDSITIIARENENTYLFTGDTLFVGDVGRPDLREKSGNMKAKRKELAKAMYDTITNKFTDLPDNTIVYPAHGAGSLCGKGMSDANSSTLGNERAGNWAFKNQSEEEFISKLLDSQPFIPSYFGYNVDLNKEGADNVREAISKVPFQMYSKAEGLVVDVRDEKTFKNNHLKHSINIQAVSKNAKFETWLGAIVKPKESFSLVIESASDLDNILNRVAKIGYEKQLKQVLTIPQNNLDTMDSLDLEHFIKNKDSYTIVDIRNRSEVDEGKFFKSSVAIPLNELRDKANNLPVDKPIVVHCAGGYRSAAGSSILKLKLDNITVYDLSDNIKEFKN